MRREVTRFRRIFQSVWDALGRAALLLLMVAVSAVAAAEEAVCSQLFTADDPALFEFVRTRADIQFADYEGYTIGDVTIVILPVFNPQDPAENNLLYRTANFFHIDTRRGTVRRQLTVRSGDTLDAFRVEESERILRQKIYFADAMIVPARVCEDRIDLLVVVRDVWTLTPIASVSREGGENTSYVGFNYDSLFGTGQQLSVAWSRDEERDSTAVVWQANELLRQRINLSAAYVDSTDGDLRQVSLQRPFYELDSRGSGGGSWQRQTRRDEIRLRDTALNRDTLLNRYGHEIDSDQVFVGWSGGIRDGRVWRWRLGLMDQADRFFATDPGSVVPQDQRLRYPWVSLESLSDQFWRSSNIAFSHRQEDISLGLRWSLSAGYASPDFDSSEEAFIFSASSGYSQRLGEQQLLQLGVATRGRWRRDDDELVGTFISAELQHYYFISRRDRWLTRLRLQSATGIREDQQFTSGGSDSLRGYPLYMQRGDRRWLMSIERRHFTDWHPFNVLRIGGAAYLDAGRTWDSEQLLAQPDDTLVNAGLGLRLSSSKFRVDRVLHLDYAVPLTAREGIDSYQIILSGRVEF